MNHRMQHHKSAGVFLLLLICSSALLGCATVEAASLPRLTADQPFYGEVSCGIEAEVNRQCHLHVEIGGLEQEVRAIVTAEVEGGVRFGDEGGEFIIEAGGHRSRSTEIEVPYRETRDIYFPLFAEQNETLSGAYIIILSVSVAELANSPFQAHTIVYVDAGSGGAQILPSRQRLDALLGEFVQGQGNLSYRIEIDPQDHTRGELVAKYESSVDGSQPELLMSVRDGIIFEQTVENFLVSNSEVQLELGIVHAAGYRVARFPFVYDSGSRSGQRIITAGYREGDTISWQEIAPVCLRLHDPKFAGTALITPELLEAEVIIDNKAIGTMRGGGSSVPAATPVAEESVNFAWDRVVTDFYGTRWDAYQVYVAGQVEMDWESFRDTVLLFNPGLRHSDFVFQADTTYVLPR